MHWHSHKMLAVLTAQILCYVVDELCRLYRHRARGHQSIDLARSQWVLLHKMVLRFLARGLLSYADQHQCQVIYARLWNEGKGRSRPASA